MFFVKFGYLFKKIKQVKFVFNLIDLKYKI